MPYYGGIIHILCSRIIFRSGNDPVLVQVRREWLDVLENGLVRFKFIVRGIDDITTTIREKSREVRSSVLLRPTISMC